MAGSAQIIERLKRLADGAGGRVYSAADYVRLTQTGGEPQQTPALYVLPTGGQGGQHTGFVGAYRQPVDLLWSIVLVLRSDTAGLRALESADVLIKDVVAALAGWDGDGMVGVFVLRRWQMISPPGPGSLAWEITFSVQDLIRIATAS